MQNYAISCTNVKGFETQYLLVPRDSLLPKAAEMHFHVLKPIAALVGKNDEHIRQCIEKIKEKKLTEKEEQFVKNILSAKFDKPFIRAMFDPMAKGTEIFFKENKY